MKISSHPPSLMFLSRGAFAVWIWQALQWNPQISGKSRSITLIYLSQKKSWSLLKREFAVYLKGQAWIYKQNFVFIFPSHKRDFHGDFLYKQYHIQQRFLGQKKLAQGMQVHAFLEYLAKLLNIKSCVCKEGSTERRCTEEYKPKYIFFTFAIFSLGQGCSWLHSSRKYKVGK